jgi:hypothetical protein
MLLSSGTEARPCGSEEKYFDINLTVYNDHVMVEDRRIGVRLPAAAAQCFLFVAVCGRSIVLPSVGFLYHAHSDRNVRAPKLLRLMQNVK